MPEPLTPAKPAVGTDMGSDTAFSELPEGDGLMQFLISQQPVRVALHSRPIVEVRAKEDNVPPLPVVDAVSIEIDSVEPAEAVQAVRQIGNSVRCIVLRNVLQRLADHRQFLGACFGKLAVDGFLLIIVPHQFLYERKLRLPSRRNRTHRKLYSPNTLLADIEEALDPCEYRLRYLTENDSGYRYDIPLHANPEGGQDIVLCLQRIERPSWADELERDETPARVPSGPTRILPIDKAAPELYQIVRPDLLGINRIIVVKLDHRGDFTMADDAFRILRSYFPTAAITLVCGSWNVAEAKQLRLFDDVLTFDFYPEDSSTEAHGIAQDELCRRFATQVTGARYDLAVDFRLYDDTREMLREVDARHRAGFDRGDSFPWLSIRFDLPSPTSDARAEAGLFLADAFLSIGRHKGYEIIFDTEKSFAPGQDLIWGPYKRLNAGRCDLEFLIEPLAEDFYLGFDVVTDDFRRTICAGRIPVRRGVHPRINLTSPARLDRTEFRIKAIPITDNVGDGPIPPFRFSGVRYYRQGAFTGVHQREAMALLAHLIPLRLQQPYLVNQV